MRLNVVKNAKRNMAVGLINKLILMMCPFVERTVIRYILGMDYLGLSSLFNSILSMLSLTELGFSSAVVYNLYKPLAEGDTNAINAILKFYRKAYRVIGSVIFAIGICLIPFLPKLVSDTYPADIHLTLLYLMYLVNVSVSYFMSAYLSSILVVYQRSDLESLRGMTIKLLLTAAQMILLVLFRDYHLFVLMFPIFTIINNLWLARTVRKRYPQYRCEGEIPREKLKDIRKLVAGTFVQKGCYVTRNSLDSIFISTLLGLTVTAIYNNYYFIISSLGGILIIVEASFVGGVGNHVTTKSVAENFDELRKVDFAYLSLGGWCMTCLLNLYQPFMKLWMGENMVFPLSTVLLFCAYFYFGRLGEMRAMYSSTNGLWWHHRYHALTEVILNLMLNFLLGKWFGVNGIICATFISMFICNYVWGGRITIGRSFGREYIRTYYLYQLKYTIINVCVCAATYVICAALPDEGTVLAILLRLVVCIVVPGFLYCAIYRDNTYFNYLLGRTVPFVLRMNGWINKAGKALIGMQILLTLFSGILLDAGLPHTIRYLGDVFTVIGIGCALISDRRKRLHKARWVILAMAAWLGYMLIAACRKDASALRIAWATRNWARGFAFFGMCVVFLDWKDVKAYYRCMSGIYVLQFALIVVQYLFLNLSGDFLGGIFGMELGCNGASNLFLCLFVVVEICRTMDTGKITPFSRFVLFSAMITAALQEIKLFYIEYPLIAVGVSFFYVVQRKADWRIILRVLLNAAAAWALGLWILSQVFPKGSMVITGERSYAKYEEISRADYQISRIHFIEEISERFFHNSLALKLTGLGFGNCEYSAVSALTSPFYWQNGETNYLFFSHVDLMLEGGLIGLGLYALIYLVEAVPFGIAALRRHGNVPVNVIGCVYGLLMLLTLIYNSAMRGDISYLIFFCMAIPFVTDSGVDRKNGKE